jgi:pimeloyl-ACP methyl ester carboxylesterase
VKGFVPTDLWEYVRRIQAPTIYILGGASTIVPLETQEQLKKTLPDCRIVIIPGLGHYPHLEAPEEYVRIVQGFLAEQHTR